MTLPFIISFLVKGLFIAFGDAILQNKIAGRVDDPPLQF